jgi:hypothetical protein
VEKPVVSACKEPSFAFQKTWRFIALAC